MRRFGGRSLGPCVAFGARKQNGRGRTEGFGFMYAPTTLPHSLDQHEPADMGDQPPSLPAPGRSTRIGPAFRLC